MASMFIDFTGGAPIKVSGIGTTVQSLPLSLDLGGSYRVLDLICSVYSIGAGGTTVATSILTSPQNAIEVPQWPVLGTFSPINTADTSVRATFTGALRFVRYSIAVTVAAGPAYVTINGYARTSE